MRIENLIYEGENRAICAFETEIKEYREDENVVVHTITTEDVDRYNTIVLTRGLRLENYRKNPIVLDSHKHDSISNIIGKAIWIKTRPDKRGLIQATKFNDTEKGREAQYLVKNGYLRASSIGFIPLKKEFRNDILVFTEADLVEVSFVPVPGNPNALIWQEQLRALSVELDVEKIWDSYLIRGVVRYKDYPPANENREWNGDEARKRIAKWASSDGSGDKDKIDWKKYKEGFAWYDDEKPENFGSYKLPHHDVIDGELHTIWNGVRAAMAALLGARGGVDIPREDRKGVYNHLAKHYEQFDKEPPEFREYREIELVNIFPEFYELEFTLLTKFDGIEKRLMELEELLRNRDIKQVEKELKELERISLPRFNTALKIARKWQSKYGQSH